MTDNSKIIFMYNGYYYKRKRKVIFGIYKITNKINGKFYIGSSNDVYDRLVHHKNELINNCHHSIYLQRSFNKYGIKNFSFELFVQYFNINLEDLRKKEEKFLRILKPKYNISDKATVTKHPQFVLDKIANYFSKEYIITYPNGQEQKIKNLNKFCKENNLSQSGMWMVANGKFNQSFGFKCRYANKPIPICNKKLRQKKIWRKV